MKKTFLELQNIDAIVGDLYEMYPNLKKSKFGWAYNRFVEKNVSPTMKERNRKLADMYADNAMEDPRTKEIMLDPNPLSRGFKFDKVGWPKMIKLEREIMDEFEKVEIEVIPYISSFVPELADDQREPLTGLII